MDNRTLALGSTQLRDDGTGSPTLAGIKFVDRDGIQQRFSATADTGTLVLTSSPVSIKELWKTAVGGAHPEDDYQAHFHTLGIVGILPVVVGGSGIVEVRSGQATGLGNEWLKQFFAGELFWAGDLPGIGKPDPQVAVGDQVQSPYEGNNPLTMNRTDFNISATGQIIALAAGKLLLIHQFVGVTAGAVNVTLVHTTGTPVNVMGLVAMDTKGIVLDYNPFGWFKTAEGVNFGAVLSASIQFGGTVGWTEVDR